MEQSIEMEWLRQTWESDTIKSHENEWIAIVGQEIVASSPLLEEVLDSIANYVNPPLLAKVVRGPIQ